jgi:Leucine-rich repeat (LRR) protein
MREMREIIKGITLYILLTGLCAACDHTAEEDLVHIPSGAFLDALIAGGADHNGDGMISYAEAELTDVIVLPPSGISDLTGIEAFLNLDSLTITLNPLSEIDLSSNSKLRYLDITYCELTHLDLSSNPLLEVLICGRNILTELDLSANRELSILICNNNLLTALDLSPVRSLDTMISCGNQLVYLDLSKHSQLKKIGVDNMPELLEVCVWTLPFPPSGVTVLQAYSPNIEYTTDCSR